MRNRKRRVKAWQTGSGRLKCNTLKMWLWWRSWHLAKHVSHKPTFNTPDIDRHGFIPVLCSESTISDWNVWRDAMHTSWVKPTTTDSPCQTCGCRTAMLKPVDYNIWRIIQRRIYQTKVNDLRQCLIDVWTGMEHSITDNAIDQWCRLQTSPRLHMSHRQTLQWL